MVSELMYHPADPPPGSSYDADDFEFVELLNAWTQPIRLAGVRLTGGIQFTFPPGDTVPLAPGERVVVVKNLEAFSTRYDAASIRIAGEYDENLSNNGEQLRLDGPLHEPILLFTYSDVWYPTTDGAGDSMVFLDPGAPFLTWGDAASWTAGGVTGGTPGEGESGGPPSGFQVPADSNQDGVVDLSDAISLLFRLFANGSQALPCDGAGIAQGGNLLLLSSNGDAGVDVSDAVYVLNFLFKSGPPPVRGTTCQRIPGCPNVCR